MTDPYLTNLIARLRWLQLPGAESDSTIAMSLAADAIEALQKRLQQSSIDVVILDDAVWIDTGPYAFKLAYDAGDDGPDALDWYAARVRFALGAKPKRPCTCSPDDNPPTPCAEKYALSECEAEGRISENDIGDEA